ncbi:copper resistance CopC family protein [Microbacterium trichothecenolyticum]
MTSSTSEAHMPQGILNRPLRSVKAAVSTVIAVALSAIVLLSSAGPAAAHDSLISTSPEAGSTVSVVPQEISLTFSGEVLTLDSAVVIEVIAPDGQTNVADGAPVVSGTTVTQAVLAEQGAGNYTVRWRVTSSDGHPISDEYHYTVDAVVVPDATPSPTTSATQEPEPTPSTTDTTGSGSHGEPSGGGALLSILAVASGAIVVGGVLVVILMVARERRRRDKEAAGTETAGAAGDGEATDET